MTTTPRPTAELHPTVTDEAVNMQRTEGLLHLSPIFLPKECKDTFALRTLNRFKKDDQWVPEGSYLVIDPHDRVIADGRLMVFFIHGCFDMRRCNVADRVWLERVAKQTDIPPIILTKDDAHRACVGWVSMILPKPDKP